MRSIITQTTALLNSRFGWLLKIVISGGLLYYFFQVIEFDKIWDIIIRFDYPYLILILILILVRHLISAIRFYYLVSIKKRMNIFLLLKQYFIASMFNVFLPTSSGGDGIRVFMLEEMGLSKTLSTFFILVERAIGFFSLILLSFLASFFTEVPNEIHFAIILITVIYAFLLGFLFARGSKTKLFRSQRFDQTREVFRSLNLNKVVYMQVFSYSIIYQAVGIFISYIVGQAFDVKIALLPFFVFVPLISLVSMIPISLGGLGLREFSFIYFFSSISVRPEDALIVSLGTYVTLVTGGLIGAFLFFYDGILIKVKRSW